MFGRSLRFALLGPVLVLAWGCPRTDDVDPAAAHAPPRTAPEELPEPAPVVPQAPDVADTRRTNDALAVAANAAEEAERGSDECESAHNQLVAMLETVERELGEPVHKPERADFLAICREMPVPARRCIVPTNAMQDQDACTAVLEALPDDLRQRFETVINGPLAD